MTPFDVVNKIIGPVRPVGETTQDNARFENLKNLVELFDQIKEELREVAKEKDQSAFSIKRAGEYAHNCLIEE